ncbi:MAG: DUF935 family protein [Methanobrevibacter sp.]|nr:DUF935 family protein [Methanobrevibacter sp.]
MGIISTITAKVNEANPLKREMTQKQSKHSNVATSNNRGYSYDYLFNRNTKNLSYRTYQNIMKDTQVKVGLEILKYFLISKNYTLTSNSDDPLDIEITEFIQDTLDNMEIPFREVVKNILTAIRYGYSVQEKVYKLNVDGKIGIKAIYPVHIKTLQKNPFIRDNTGEIESIHQESTYGSVDLPRDKCLIYSFDKEFDEIEGNSILNEIKPIVEDKEDTMDWLMTFASKNRSPTMYGKTDDKVSGDNMLAAFDDVADGTTGMILGTDDEVGILESSHNGDTYFNILNYKDNQIFRRMFIGTLLLGNQSQTGSYAQANVQQDFMMYIMDGILADVASEVQFGVINELTRLNYGVEAKAPQFNFESFNSKDILGLLSALQPFVANGSLDSDTPAFQELLAKAFQVEADIKMDVETLDEETDEDEFGYQPPLPGQSEAEQLIQEQLTGII